MSGFVTSRSAQSAVLSVILLLLMVVLYLLCLHPSDLAWHQYTYTGKQLMVTREQLVQLQNFVMEREFHNKRKCKGVKPIKQWHGQGFEDKAVHDRYFSKPELCGGTFVEIGAYNGISLSNTLAFERDRGWSGLLIEANIGNYNALVKNRPKTPKLYQAVCKAGQKQIKFAGGGGVGGVLDTMPERHRKGWNINANSAVLVPCSTMGNILQEANIKYVDFFSLDTEGSEVLILSTFDWTIPVHVWVIEYSLETRPKINKIMTSHGYVPVLEKWKISSYCRGPCLPNLVFEHPNFQETVREALVGARQNKTHN